MQIYDKLYIGGQWTPSASSSSMEVINASTEEVMGKVPAGTTEDINRAVDAARQAFDGWAATPTKERSEVLYKLHEGLVARSEEIASIITQEVGMPLKLSRYIQAGLPIAVMENYARMANDFQFEELIGNSLIIRESVGITACITPWNYPLHQIVAKVAPALAAGGVVVVKPSSEAPLTSFLMAEIIDEAGVPPGVFNLISGPGRIIGEALARHPEVDMISFTGSTATGRKLSALAADTIKRLSLELGGKSAAIILDDADLPSAVNGVVGACFLNSGQTCSAHTRMLVPEKLYGEIKKLARDVVGAYVPGDPSREETRLGPLVSATQREKVRRCIKAGIREGAELLIGGAEAPTGLDKGYYVTPTAFGGVHPKMSIAQEEIFGPVLSIITYRDEDEAVRIANDTIYGLSGGVWSSDAARAKSIARRLRTGQVDINGAQFNIHAPFGGFKQSGKGRELGKFGLEEFLEIKSIQL